MDARAFALGALIGAGFVYFFDRERGPRRHPPGGGRVAPGSGVSARYGSRVGDIDGLAAANLRATAARAQEGQGARPERRHTVDIQKSMLVAAPIEQVFAFWSTYENLSRFLTGVREVRELGEGRSRWVVGGPHGEALSWTAVLTEYVPHRQLAWRSEPGAVLENAGALRFSPEGTGTRIDFRFCYSPPAGVWGDALVDFFGGDPRARINDDLGRLKRLLETTARSDSHGEESGS